MPDVNTAIALAMHAAVAREFRKDPLEERELALKVIEQLDFVRFSRTVTALVWLLLVVTSITLGAVAGTSGTIAEGVLFGVLPIIALLLADQLWLRPQRERAVAAVIAARVGNRETFARVLRAAGSVKGTANLVREFSQETVDQPRVS